MSNTMYPQLDRLRQAQDAYDDERWYFVSRRIGKGISAAACEEKARELGISAVGR